VNKNNSFFLFFVTAALFFWGGCSSKNPLPLNNNTSSVKLDVPFVAPRSELCASSSIAMVSSYWQVKAQVLPRLTLEELDSRTLIPQKGGTLQIELMAAARANGFLVYQLEQNIDALVAELSVGHPVIVLVNRSFSWAPLWHYAPVTGYDAQMQTVLSHFADEANEAVPLATFEAIWERSQKWGVVLLPPGKIPATATPRKFLSCVYELEKSGMLQEALLSYKAASTRWPENVEILFALGNAYYGLHQLNKAEEMYRKILFLDAVNPLALNNLADISLHKGKLEEAESLLNQAKTDDVAIEAILNATRQEIEKARVSPIKNISF
jgi:tetratricopeptide (TPR) repeat protein